MSVDDEEDSAGGVKRWRRVVRRWWWLKTKLGSAMTRWFQIFVGRRLRRSGFSRTFAVDSGISKTINRCVFIGCGGVIG